MPTKEPVPAPAVIAHYLKAADEKDSQALASCFTADGTVVDEGVTYRGRQEIAGWRDALAGRWTYTSSVLASEPVGATDYRVTVHVEGDFPGGEANLTYRFALDDGLISALSIVE